MSLRVEAEFTACRSLEAVRPGNIPRRTSRLRLATGKRGSRVMASHDENVELVVVDDGSTDRNVK
jgi:glycosyltransferase involved in cell wall biosynthesis